MKPNLQLLALLTSTLTLAACGLETGTDTLASGGHHEHIEVRDLQTGDFVDGSSAKLKRRSHEVSTKVKTVDLPPNTDVFVIWAIFNFPDECKIGNPLTGSPCGPADLANDAVGGSISFYALENTGKKGKLKLSGTLAVGDTSGCVAGLPCRDGLTDPYDAEVHVVIIDDASGDSLQGAQFIPEEDDTEVLRVRDLVTGDPVIDSRAELEREDDELETEVRTTGLPANTDVFVIWAIFNYPEECTVGNAQTGAPCGPGDLANDAVGGSVIFYALETTSSSGALELENELDVGDISGCVPGLPCREGLTNPLGAEVHVVIIDDASGDSLQGAQFIP